MVKQTSATGGGAGSQRKWTVMVFMGADGVEGNVPLAREASSDINEMEEVIRQAGSDGALNIFVQVHGDGEPRRQHIGHDPGPVPHDERDVTNGQALASFIRWALDPTHHAPEDYSMLVLWGHAYQFGIGHTETRAGIDALDFAELAEVLRRVQERYALDYGMGSSPKLDIVGFDACDLATVEMTVQLGQFADFLLASQIGIPLPGWPYHKVLDRLKTPKGEVMDAAELGTYIVRRFCEAYHAEDRAVSLTLLNLKLAGEIADHVELLARRLAVTIAADRAEREIVDFAFSSAQTDEDKPFVDVAGLCLTLMRRCSSPYVTDAAKRLGNLLITPPVNALVVRASTDGQRRPFIVEHGRNAASTAGLHGVSLYAPQVADTHDWMDASYWYRKFAFSQESLWNGLVHTLARGVVS